jgi:hypothetical protein
MNVAWGRLVIIALAAFVTSAAPEFDAAWKTQHISDNATYGTVTKALILSSVEGIRAGIPAMATALIAFFMRQDSNLPVFTAKLPEVRKVSETTRDIDG